MKKRTSATAITILAVSLSLLLIFLLAYFISNYVSPEKTTVTFKSADATKVYDGLPLENHDWEIVWGTLNGSHTASVRVYGSQTEIGSSMNFFEVTIKDVLGNDVTDKYNVLLELGVLTVIDPQTPSDDDTNNNTDTPAAGGENGTENGGTNGGGGTDGSGNGNGGTGSGSDGSGSGTDGNGGGGGGGEGEGEGMNFALKINPSRGGLYYLRHKSYGNYTGTDWDGLIRSYANMENPLLFLSYAMANAGYPLETMQVITKTGQYYSPYHFSDKELCDNDDRILPYGGKEYTVHYYYDYDVSTLKGLSLAGTGYETAEKQYRNYVYKNYLTLSNNEKAVLLKLAADAGIDKDDPNVIEKVASYIQNAAAYNLYYEEYPDDVNHVIYFLNVAREGVCEQYASAATLMFRALGIPARYVTGYMAEANANEWTVINASIGHAWVEVYIDGLGWIPVEVTGSSDDGIGSGIGGGNVEGPGQGSGGGSGEGQGEGEGEGTGSGNGSGNGSGEGTGSGNGSGNGSGEGNGSGNGSGSGSGSGSGGGFGTGNEGGTLIGGDKNEQNKTQKLTLAPVYMSKQYDGTPLLPKQEITGFGEWEKLGFSYEVSISGSQTDYGYGTSTIESLVIKDPDGNIVTKQFDITLSTGKLHVYYSVLRARSQNLTKSYDDLPVDVSYINVTGALMAGHYTVLTSTASTDVGTKYNSFKITVLDENGTDVSAYYELDRTFGSLQITERAISLKANDATKVYDGTPLTSNGYTVSAGALLDGHQVTAFTVTGKQIEIGRSDNLLTAITITNAEGKDVTSNYTIELLPGKLRVTER